MPFHFTLLTGEPSCGKSTLLRHVIHALRDVQVMGFLQPTSHDDTNTKIGYDIVLISNNDISDPIPLARKNPNFDDNILHLFQIRPAVPRYIFDDKSFTIARKHLIDCYSRDKQYSSPFVFIVDELGWLEQEGSGHWTTVHDLIQNQVEHWGHSDNFHIWWLFSVRKGLSSHFIENIIDTMRNTKYEHEIIEVVSGSNVDELSRRIVHKIYACSTILIY